MMSDVLDVKTQALAQADDAVRSFATLAGPIINGYAFCDLAKQKAAAREGGRLGGGQSLRSHVHGAGAGTSGRSRRTAQACNRECQRTRRQGACLFRRREDARNLLPQPASRTKPTPNSAGSRLAALSLIKSLKNNSAGQGPRHDQFEIAQPRSAEAPLSAATLSTAARRGRRDRHPEPDAASSAAGLRAASSCARACGPGGSLPPFRVPSFPMAFRNGRAASSRGKCPRAASSSSAP